MQRAIAFLFSIFAAWTLSAPVAAQQRVVTTVVEEWIVDENGVETLVSSEIFVEQRIGGSLALADPPILPLDGPVVAGLPAGATAPSAVRFLSPLAATTESRAVAAFGPFRVLDGRRAALVDVTDGHSPRYFAAMLEAYPGIEVLELVEVPGTFDDRANLALGRMIRAEGIATHVPEGGSVRSGGVELYLAGASRSADPRAEFAVHAWMDQDGMEATDYAPDSPEHRRYLDYYAEMGMDEGEASAFYWMTNSVGFGDALWLTGEDMARWLRENAPEKAPAPQLAYLDLPGLLQ